MVLLKRNELQAQERFDVSRAPSYRVGVA